MSRRNEERAFPAGDRLSDQAGMAMRDWFAGQALAVVASLLGRDVGTADMLARDAYTLADAMLLARQQEKG